MIRKRVLVSGRVQGVYYRDACRRAARNSAVHGWVRNLPDGRVEAVFEGPADQVEQMVRWAGRGPELAVVTDVTVQEEPPEGLAGFTVR